MAINVTLVGAPDRQLETRLRAAGMRPVSISPGELTALAHPSSAPPDIIVLDLRSQAQIPGALAPFKRQHPETGVIILATTLDPALMLDAMRAGINECVLDLAGGELETAITRLVTQRTTPDAGEIFVFVGAKGGVCTTTVAVNIATALAKVGSTLVIDLHLAGGDTALFFGAEPRFSVGDALENTHRLDIAYFRDLVTRTKAGPDLLASVDRAVAVGADPPHIRALIEFAARHYRYTVLDVPRSDSAALDALDAATMVVIVANQELPTVRAAARLSQMLRNRYGKDKVTVVLSRSDRRSEIGREDLERAVGCPIRHTFPSDYREALEALNRGQPMVAENQTPLAAALQACARDLAGLTPEAAAPEKDKTSSFLGLRIGRRS